MQSREKGAKYPNFLGHINAYHQYIQGHNFPVGPTPIFFHFRGTGNFPGLFLNFGLFWGVTRQKGCYPYFGPRFWILGSGKNWRRNGSFSERKNRFFVVVTPILVHFLLFYFAKTDFFIFSTLLSDREYGICQNVPLPKICPKWRILAKKSIFCLSNPTWPHCGTLSVIKKMSKKLVHSKAILKSININ